MTDCAEAQDLLNRIFVPNPKRRITLEEICTHPWMQGSSLDDMQLKETMHARKMKIEAILAREKAMLLRQEGVRRGLGSDSDQAKVDVFKRNTHRRFVL